MCYGENQLTFGVFVGATYGHWIHRRGQLSLSASNSAVFVYLIQGLVSSHINIILRRLDCLLITYADIYSMFL